jgi:hypothetical protein
MTTRHGIDEDEVIRRFAQAGARQGVMLREWVARTTGEAFKARELTQQRIRQVLETMARAVSVGAARNPNAQAVDKLLARAREGMDLALQQALVAQRRVLEQFASQGVDLSRGEARKALAQMEAMESRFFDSVRKAVARSDAALQGPWQSQLEKMQSQGTGTGAVAQASLERLLAETQQRLQQGRTLGVKATQAMLDSYAGIAGGVLMGMLDAVAGAQAVAGGAK